MLDRLRLSCDTELRSFLDAEQQLAWRVSLRLRAGGPGSQITFTEREISDAATRAVEEAVRRGWITADSDAHQGESSPLG